MKYEILLSNTMGKYRYLLVGSRSRKFIIGVYLQRVDLDTRVLGSITVYYLSLLNIAVYELVLVVVITQRKGITIIIIEKNRKVIE